MAKRVKFEGQTYTVPDDASDDEIIQFVESQVAKVGSGGGHTPAPTGSQTSPKAPTAPSMPMNIAGHPLFAAAQRGADLSSLMALPGGFAPGPLGAGISAFGGGAGELFEQLARGQQINPAAIGMEAVKQGVLGMAGLGLAKGGGYVARQMMQGALRPVLGMSRSAPNLAEDALQQGATVGQVFGRGGLPSAKREVGKRAAKTGEMLRRATAATAPLPGGAIARIRFRMSALLPNKADVVHRASPRRAKELEEARGLIEEIAQNYKGAKSPVELKEIKQQLQARAKSSYEAIAQGKRFSPDAPDLPVESRVYWLAAQNVQKALEAIPEAAAGGSIKAAEKATQKAINVAGAVKRSEDVMRSGVTPWIPQVVGRGGAAATGMAIGATADPENRTRGALLGTLAGSAAAAPTVLSRLAYLLYNPATMGTLSNAPRLADMLFNSGALPDSLNRR